MTLVLIGKGLVLGSWPSKIEVIWVSGIRIRIYIYNWYIYIYSMLYFRIICIYNIHHHTPSYALQVCVDTWYTTILGALKLHRIRRFWYLQLHTEAVLFHHYHATGSGQRWQGYRESWTWWAREQRAAHQSGWQLSYSIWLRCNVWSIHKWQVRGVMRC